MDRNHGVLPIRRRVASLIVARNGNGLSINKIVEITNIGKKDYLAGYGRLAALNEPFKFVPFASGKRNPKTWSQIHFFGP